MTDLVEEGFAADGPTGNWCEVLLATICDAGDNEFAEVTSAAEVEEFLDTHRGGPYYLQAQKLGDPIVPVPNDCRTMGNIGNGRA